MPSCSQHPERKATGACRSCDLECCADCLVFSFGRYRRPYCVRCALIASGVRVPDNETVPYNVK